MNNILLKNEKDEHRVPVHLLDPMYEHVIRKVSSYALDIANKAYVTAKSAKDPLGPCSGYSRRCLGIPCKRLYQRYIAGVIQVAKYVPLPTLSEKGVSGTNFLLSMSLTISHQREMQPTSRGYTQRARYARRRFAPSRVSIRDILRELFK